jgi:hypothetical protein
MGCGVAAAIAQRLGSAHQRTARPGEINYAFVDPYSLAHAAVGALLGLVGLRLGAVLTIAIGWELAEHVLKNVVPAAFPHPTQDTLANSMGDILSALLGWAIARGAAAARAHRHSSRHA